MKKRTYISPETVRLEMEAVAQVMAGSQPPYADAKQHTIVDDDDASWQDDNPWETVAKPKDLWE